MAEKQIVVERRVKKRLSVARIKEQLQKIGNISMKSGRGAGWTFRLPQRIVEPIEDGDEQVYRVTLTFSTTSKRESLLDKWDRIVKRFAEAACAGPFRATPWVVVEPSGYRVVASKAQAEEEKARTRKAKMDEDKVLGEINLEPNGHYARLYNRDAQINRILGALRLGKRTAWDKRTHSILDGPPGCGKTEIMLATSRMLGNENEAWRWFDATSMTKAGVLEELIESPVVPPVLFIEEIEKCDEASLRWLLGVMDTRGQIRRTNYRVGNQAKNVRMCVIASANDVNLLRRLMSGALYSRFQNKIYCPRPDRVVMEQILTRECQEIKGKKDWIEPTLEFAYDKWCMTDPRDVITIMSCGGDQLLSGRYQDDYEKTMHPSEKKRLLAAKRRRDGEDAVEEPKAEADGDGDVVQPAPKHPRRKSA